MKTRFDGIDYCELADHFEIGPVPDEDEYATTISKWLWDQMKVTAEDGPYWPGYVIDGCRDFLTALSKHDSPYSPVWEALGDLDHQFSFMLVFTHMLPYMWM